MLQNLPLKLETVQFAAVNASYGVQPLNDDDAALLMDVQKVLSQYNAESRFGISLIQPGFDLEENEATFEVTDEEKRISFISVKHKDGLEHQGTIVTNWQFSETMQTAMRGCAGFCHYFNGHKYIHNRKEPSFPENTPSPSFKSVQ